MVVFISTEARQGARFTGTSCELPNEYWELNPRLCKSSTIS